MHCRRIVHEPRGITHDTVGATDVCTFQQQGLTAIQSCAKDGASGAVLVWTDGGATAKFRYLFVVQIGT